MPTVQCPRCGQENKSTNNFCTECGCPLHKIKRSDSEVITPGIDYSSVLSVSQNNSSNTAKQTGSAAKPYPVQKKRKDPPVWPFFAIGAAIIGLVVFLIVNLVCVHEYADATCEEPKTCIKCGKTEGYPLGHKWLGTSCDEPRKCSRCGIVSNRTSAHDWHISGDQVSCNKCEAVLTTAEDIKAKKGKGLTGADKALIYDWLDYYLTAQNSNGKYTYSENEAFRKVQEKFGVTREYINNNVWNYHAYEDYAFYR